MKCSNEKGKLLPLGRAFTVLKICAASHEGSSFSDLLKGLAPATPGALSRLLKAMINENILEKKKSGTYGVGSSAMELSMLIKGGFKIEDAAKLLLDSLASDTGRSAAFFELNENGAFLLAKSEVSEGFHYINLHKAMPKPAEHGLGQILIAFGSNKDKKLLCSDYECGFVNDRKYMKRLDEIRNGRWLISDWRNDVEISRIAAPVFFKGKIKGVLGLSFHGPVQESDESRAMERLVKNTTERVSKLYESNNGDV